MGELWAELGKKLADRWLTLLVLPGVLYLAVAAAALMVNHSHAFDVGLLTRQITDRAKNPAVTSIGGQAVLLGAVLVAAAVAGLVAQALGTFTERIALAAEWQSWPGPIRALARQRIKNRRSHWLDAHKTYHSEYRKALAPNPADRPDPATRHRAANRRAKIAVELPERPTWSGDRIHAAAMRLDRDHHLDLGSVWPYLWLILPDPARDQIAQARAALSRATTLAAWSLLYLVLAIWWWPAAPLSAVIAVIAHRRIRTTTDTYAHLLEATTRLYSTALAAQLGITFTGPLTPEIGHTLTWHLQHIPPLNPT
ncbi:hypothetical protein ACIHDR_43505 [Nocardia sp. NPDC052278]|uniref:hypothetical protein n=1 Tax=unclassified Nocardia TaxID=2637762 RepID=UPI0036858E24